jgi:hypothetical protein
LYRSSAVVDFVYGSMVRAGKDMKGAAGKNKGGPPLTEEEKLVKAEMEALKVSR